MVARARGVLVARQVAASRGCLRALVARRVTSRGCLWVVQRWPWAVSSGLAVVSSGLAVVVGGALPAPRGGPALVSRLLAGARGGLWR